MPYAKRRKSKALNRAYAHLASPDFAVVAKQLTDKLIDMGFESMEVAENLLQGNPNQHDLYGEQDSGALLQLAEPTFRYEVEVEPDLPLVGSDATVTPTPHNTFSIEIIPLASKLKARCPRKPSCNYSRRLLAHKSNSLVRILSIIICG